MIVCHHLLQNTVMTHDHDDGPAGRVMAGAGAGRGGHTDTPRPGRLTRRPASLLTAPSGRERYLEELASLAGHGGPADQSAIIALRARYDIEQLTPMIPDRRRSTG